MTTRIALVGNPNSGKTTVFNNLTGSSQKVGNWPGVTIDKKEGKLKGSSDIKIIDLPGIYSLSPYSPEEIVSRDFLLHDKPEAIVNIVDASNLERNLYLTTQLLEFGIPTIIVLNMMDVLQRNGDALDSKKLSEELGCPVIETCALKGQGIKKLITTITEMKNETFEPNKLIFSKDTEEKISEISDLVEPFVPSEFLRWYAIKILEKDNKAIDVLDKDTRQKVSAIIDDFEKLHDDESDSIIADERYNLIGDIVGKSSKKAPRESMKMNLSDKIDRIVTNRWLGLPIFACVMFLVYYIAVTTLGAIGTDWMNDTVFGEYIIPGAEEFLTGLGLNEILIGLLVHGIIAGVGAVIGFLPQMLLLFILLAILEECGYMSRIAFVMDRVFRKFGLSGKSFIPVLIGTGCAVPGIMASRTIEGESERKITAVTTSFIPCGAKLPVIALIAAALFGSSALIAVSIYFIGIFCILISGLILKKIKNLSGTPLPFIMELPPYHIPLIKNVLLSMLQRGWAFVKKAGTFILIAVALIWILAHFDTSFNYLSDDNISQSILADLGNAFRYVFIPLGFGDDWEFTVATITGLLAKETVVGTFEILLGDPEAVLALMLTPIAGFSFLLFNMICAPCFAAVGAMRRELGGWKATGLAVLYQCVLAYVVAIVFYQFALIFTGGFSWWIILAIIMLAGLVYLMVSKNPMKIVSTIKEKI